MVKFKAKNIGLQSSPCGAMKTTIFHEKLDVSSYDESLGFEVMMIKAQRK